MHEPRALFTVALLVPESGPLCDGSTARLICHPVPHVSRTANLAFTSGPELTPCCIRTLQQCLLRLAATTRGAACTSAHVSSQASWILT